MAVVMAGCDSPDRSEVESADDPLDWSEKNCLIVVLDALTVNHLALWGYDRETTPNIDRLAARGVVFKYARSQASSTPPSVYSYFTGQYPPLLLQASSMRMVQLPEERTTFAEAFKGSGYDTGAFSENLFVSAKAGYDQGFDTFELVLRHLLVSTGHVTPDEGSTAKLLESAKHWIQSRDENPWLCYLHILRPHNPYSAPEPQGRAFAGDYDGPVDGSDAYWESVNWKPKRKDMPRLKDSYDGNLLYADWLLGEFFDALEESDDLKDTAIIVTSDHGEEFMEHGYTLHNLTVHEEVIRVPLIVVPPGDMSMTPRTIMHPVQLIDLFPTMAALFRLSAASGMDGESLVPVLKGLPINDRPAFAQDGDGDIMCIIERDRKLVIGYDSEDSSFKPIALYRLTRDPGETRNLWRGLPPSEAAGMFERAQGYIESHIQDETSQGEDLVEYEKEILETLGYL